VRNPETTAPVATGIPTTTEVNGHANPRTAPNRTE
jgi:hypothetical protein